MDKRAYTELASNNQGSSFVPPWAMLSGGIKVLPAIEKMMPGWNSENKEERDKAHWNAAMAQTIMCAAALGVGMTGVGKLMAYTARRRGIGENDNPVAGMQSKLNMTFDPFSNVKTAAAQPTKKEDKPWALPFPALASKKTFASVALPLLAVAATAGITDTLVDSWTENRDAKRISEKLNRRSALTNDLFIARAKNARGRLSDDEYKKLENRIMAENIGIPKQAAAKKYEDGLIDSGAGLVRKLVAGTGMLAAGILAASAIGSYYWTDRSDPNNIRYRAMKKGLKEYAKGKAAMSPITIAEPSDKLLEAIDGPQDTPSSSTAADTPRSEQDMSAFLSNKPVSVSFDD